MNSGTSSNIFVSKEGVLLNLDWKTAKKKKETKDFLIFPDPYKLQNAGYVAVAVVEFSL